jgi:hypothetical protein
MRVQITPKHMTTVMVATFTLLFCSIAMCQQPAPAASPEESKGTTNEAQKAAPSSGGNLNFLDDQQVWRDSEISGYEEWLKRNPRHSHPMFTSQWDTMNNISRPVDDKPDPNYRPWSYSMPWYQRGAVTNVRGRILWVNDRYPSGKYYSSKGSNQPASDGKAQAAPAPSQGTGSTTLMPKAESSDSAQGK